MKCPLLPPPSPATPQPAPSPSTLPSDTDIDEEMTPQLPVAKNNHHVQDLKVPGSATANAEDPVYQRMRKHPPTWPQMLSPKGKLKDYVYNGAGWWFHVCNPDRPRAPLSLLDI